MVVVPDAPLVDTAVFPELERRRAVELLEKALSQKSWPAVIPLVRAALKALRGEEQGTHAV